MKKSLILCIAAATGLVLGSLAQAATPNSTRTLTTGIGSGTTTSRVPSSHPWSSRSRGYANSGHSRNSRADRSLGNYAGGTSHRPADAYRSGGSNSSYGRPGSIPADIPSQATERVPTRIGGGTGVSNPPPSSIPANIPARAAGHVPAGIGNSGMSGATGMSSAVSNPPPVTIPAALPGQAAGHVPATIGSAGVSNPPPSAIPANIPAQAAGHVPGTIGGRP
jgi:hypothetical protein